MRPRACSRALTAPALAALLLACAGGPSRPFERADAAPDAPSDDASGCAPEASPCDAATHACVPGALRCSPDDPPQSQRCADDGAAHIDVARCDPAAGSACVAGRCVDRCAPSQTSYLGCEYDPTVTANTRLRNGFQFAVALSDPQPHAVHVDLTGGGLGAGMAVELAPGEVRTLALPWVAALRQHASEAFPLPDPVSVLAPGCAYRVRASGPIAAYQFNPLEYRGSDGSNTLTNHASLLLRPTCSGAATSSPATDPPPGTVFRN